MPPIRLRSPTDTILELDVDGTSIVIVDDGGKPTRRKFVTAVHAQAQLDRLVAAKCAEGYALIAEAVDSWPPPDALDELSVASDDRQRRGDPRGAITQLQLEIERRGPDASVDLIASSLEALTTHAAHVLGDLAKHAGITTHGQGGGKKHITVDFRRGYIDAVTMAGTARMPIATAYALLRANPLATYLRSLEVGVAATVSKTFHYFDLATAIAKHGMFEHLQRLALGCVPASPTWRINLGDLTDIVAQAPALEMLALRGGKLVLGALPPALRELALEGPVGEAMLRLVREAPCRLERLSLRAVKGPRTPLGHALAAATMHRGLRALVLNGYDGSQAHDLVDVVGAFPQLVELDLSSNTLPPEIALAVRERFPAAVVSPQALLKDLEDRYDGIRE